MATVRKGKTPFSDRVEAAESQVKDLCEFIGYGRVMQIASEAWQEKDDKGAFQIGTCVGLTEPCGCEKPSKCDWCCGTGWLTKHVKSLKNSLQQD